MAKTAAQKKAEKKAKAESQKKADEQALAEAQAEKEAHEQEATQQETDPVVEPVAPSNPAPEPPSPSVDDGSVHFCARFKKYRCRGTQFDNFRAAVTDPQRIAELKADPKYGTEFWICQGNQNAA
ncbi:MAG: hypothetical protein ACWA5W_02610 [Phycisphaerales bacterium]